MTDQPPAPDATAPSADEAGAVVADGVSATGTGAEVQAGADATSGAGAGNGPEVVVPAPGASAAEAPRTRGRGPAIVAIALLTVLAGGALFLSGWTMGQQAALTPGTPVDEAKAFQPFWDTWRAVTERYAGGEVDRKKLIEGSIKGMIGALEDPYSMYLTSEEFKASLRDISGEFEGIGATIGAVNAAGETSSCTDLGPDCRMVIVAPIPDSPADRAGLEPGDIVVAIDGTPVAGQTLEEARSRVRGPKDTTVVLSIERAGASPMDVEITRAVIISPEVEARDLADGNVGYIRLIGFSDHAAEELARVAGEDIKAGRKALILDLRGNPGGFVTAARSIASQFLADGTIFWKEDAEGNLQETVAQAGGAATDSRIPLVVLVDGGSASASEIVAGALQDRGRATLVGTKTFGKGTVQQWTQLEDDAGGFRLTVAKWLTPDKTWIHKAGITPDVVVEEAPARPGDDPALTKALEVLGFGETTGTVLRAAA
jgi:carboxyl-terminal processing protease